MAPLRPPLMSTRTDLRRLPSAKSVSLRAPKPTARAKKLRVTTDWREDICARPTRRVKPISLTDDENDSMDNDDTLGYDEVEKGQIKVCSFCLLVHLLALPHL